jgi:hypothetical protein
MGWSCTSEVGNVLDRMRAAGNVFAGVEVDGHEFFVEVSNREYADGHASCTVMEIVPGSKKPDGSALANKKGSFSIRPDGSMPKAPAWLRAMVG